MTLPRLLVVVDGNDEDRGRRALVRALAELATVEVAVLAWTSGPLVADLAGVAPVTDAGQVNHWTPARLLARAGLRPAARLLKNRRLRQVLDRSGRADGVLLLGHRALAARGWLAAPCAALLGADDLGSGPDPAGELGDAHVVATDAVAAGRLEGLDLPDARRHVLGLLTGDLPGAAPDRIGLLGWDAAAVGRIAAAVPDGDDGPRLTWFVPEQEGWALWQGPDASPFATRVDVVAPEAAAPDVGRLTVLVEGRPDHTPVGPAAGLLGVPIVACGPHGIDRAVAAVTAPWERAPALTGSATVSDTATVLVGLLLGDDG